MKNRSFLMRILILMGIGLVVSATSAASSSSVSEQYIIRNPSGIRARKVSTLLWQAASRGDLVQVNQLLRKTQRVDFRGEANRTPLYVAAKHGHDAVVERLLEAGAAVDAVTSHGATPLYAAAKHGHEAVVKRLLAAGAQVNVAMKDGATPLHIAALKGHDAVVQRLIAAGADVNVATQNGVTSLYAAAGNGHVNTVKLLLEHGADARLQTNDVVKEQYRNKKPEQVAFGRGYQQLGRFIQYYREHGHMPTEPTSDSDGIKNSCRICLEDSIDGELFMRLSCGHIFHESPCIKGWLDSGKSNRVLCPICRAHTNIPAEQNYVMMRDPIVSNASSSGGASANASSSTASSSSSAADKSAPVAGDEQ